MSLTPRSDDPNRKSEIERMNDVKRKEGKGASQQEAKDTTSEVEQVANEVAKNPNKVNTKKNS